MTKSRDGERVDSSGAEETSHDFRRSLEIISNAVLPTRNVVDVNPRENAPIPSVRKWKLDKPISIDTSSILIPTAVQTNPPTRKSPEQTSPISGNISLETNVDDSNFGDIGDIASVKVLSQDSESHDAPIDDLPKYCNLYQTGDPATLTEDQPPASSCNQISSVRSSRAAIALEVNGARASVPSPTSDDPQQGTPRVPAGFPSPRTANSNKSEPSPVGWRKQQATTTTDSLLAVSKAGTPADVEGNRANLSKKYSDGLAAAKELEVREKSKQTSGTDKSTAPSVPGSSSANTSTSDQSPNSFLQTAISTAPTAPPPQDVGFASSMGNPAAIAPMPPPTLPIDAPHVAIPNDVNVQTVIRPEQSLPSFTTSRLIQNLRQSEMNVGLHSSEFGNISIRTSSTQNLLSAQISLDHGDLAKTIATHLPEMQARLGSSHAGTIEVQMNGLSSRSSDDSSSGFGNGSQNSRRSSNNRYSGKSFGESGTLASSHSAIASVLTIGDSESRLDVRF
jgi:hypothetical protein